MPQTALPTDAGNPGGYTHISALDGIRGLAISLVLIHHLLWSNNLNSSALLAFLTEFRGSAFIGVNLFFVLSGFLITGILLDTVATQNYFRNFYARRSLRIFPLYYGSLIALLLLSRPMHFNWNGWEWFYLTYTSNLALWKHTLPDLAQFNIRHFWSLQVEEQFYFVWPLVVLKVRRPETLARVCAAGGFTALAIRTFIVLMHKHPAFQDMYLAYQPTFCCADNLLFGCGLSALLHSRWRVTASRLAPRIFAFTALATAVSFVLCHGLSFKPADGFYNPTVGLSLVGICSASVIAMAIEAGSFAESFFNIRVLRFLGKYSYGLYVLHYSIFGFLDGPLRQFFNAKYHSKGAAVVLAGLIIFCLSVIAALLSYHFYEVPFLRLKRFFNYNRTATRVRITETA